MPLGIWLAAISTYHIADGSIQVQETLWGDIAAIISVAFSMAVNALVTGLIVYRIFKAFRKVQQSSTSAEKSLGIIGGRNYRSIIFVVIESGMALFAIQLLRVILGIPAFSNSTPIVVALNYIIAIHEMLNVIITLVIVLLIFILLITTWLGYNTYHRPGAGVDGIVFQRREIFRRSRREFVLCV